MRSHEQFPPHVQFSQWQALSETGIISTMGYDRFQDGILLSLSLSRVSDDHYSLDMELEVSTFDKGDTSSSIPTQHNRSRYDNAIKFRRSRYETSTG